MSLQFYKSYFIIFIALLAIEILIATCFTNGFIRYTFGDYLVVILLYCFFKSFINSKPIYIAIGVLFIAFVLEFLQYYHFLNILNLQDNTLAKLILGSTFHCSDLVSYTLGIATVLIIEHNIKSL